MAEYTQPVADSPEQRLAKLQKEFSDSESGLAKQTKAHESLKQDVAELEKSTKEIQDVAANYARTLPTLKKDKDDGTGYFETKQKMIDAALGPKKEKVLGKINGLSAVIAAKEQEVQQLESKKSSAVASYESANATKASTEAAFNAYKQRPENWRKALQEVKELKTQIEKAEELNQYATMFFLAGELKKALDQAPLPSPEDFKSRIVAAWSEFDQAKTALRIAKTSVDTSSIDLDKGQKELTDLKKNRRDQIIAAINEFN